MSSSLLPTDTSSNALVELQPQSDSVTLLPTNSEYDPLPPWENMIALGSLDDTSNVHQDSGFNIETKLEEIKPEITFPVQYDPAKEEWGIDEKFNNVESVSNTLSEWQPSEDLMQIILNEDSTLSGFTIRLDDDAYVDANKESALTVFGVCTTNCKMAYIQSGNISFLRAELPPDNLQTYRWRGDMGLLDRLSYGNSTAIPRNWRMTSLDAGRIAERNQSLMLTLEPQPTSLITNLPQRTFEQNCSITTTNSHDFAVAALLDAPTEMVGPPPKKKRSRHFTACAKFTESELI
jgi:hypothetical protein